MAEDGVLLPRFFKVFLSESSSESLMIPMSFLEHLHDPLPTTAKLQGPGGVWTVGFTKIREQAYFTDGWSKFAKDHELKTGEFMTFVYDGHRIFEVSVFGRGGFKETRAVADSVEESDSDEDDEEEEEDASMDADDDELNFGEDEIGQSLHPLESEETETDDAVFVGSSDLEVRTKNPCFKTHLKPRIYELLIPAPFVRKHKLRFGKIIKYVDEEGTLQGKRGKWSDNRVCYKGWDRICRRNKLRYGDIVKCEILHIRKFAHSVKIHVKRARARA